MMPVKLSRRHVLGIAAVPAATQILPSGDEFNVRRFGAKGDGMSFDTGAIQAAIDACARSGGGTVRLATGRFLSKPLILRSNINLHLETGAVLLGSPHRGDYPERPPSYVCLTSKEDTRRALLFADREENISVTGEGTIDGQGYSDSFREGRLPMGERALIILFGECRRVKLSGIRLTRSSGWMQCYLACEDVLVDGISVENRPQGNRNYDGIDLVDSWRVCIVNSRVRSSDDAICLKSSTSRSCRDIVVSNCLISTGCNAIKMGTDSTGGFRNIAIGNCSIYDTRLAGLALECVDGGLLEQIAISNISMEGVGCPIFLRLGNLSPVI